jgi:alpha-amylase
MKSICLVFQVHQPVILKRYHFFDIGTSHDYFDDHAMESNTQKLASLCYLPMNDLLFKHISNLNGRFKIAVFISGVTLEQFAIYSPEVIESFKKLADTGCVEFLSGTWSHSLSSLADDDAFSDQVRLHQQIILEHFKQTSGVFMNPGLIYSDEIGNKVAGLGFHGIFTEGASQILGKRSPGFIYSNTLNSRLRLLMRFPKLLDDMKKQFMHPSSNVNNNTTEIDPFRNNSIETVGEVIPLLLNYETFENIRRTKTGAMHWLDHMLLQLSRSDGFSFDTPADIISLRRPVATITVRQPVSSAGPINDISYWTGNEIQNEALNKLYALSPLVKNCKDAAILKDWNYLQTHEHFLHMSEMQENDAYLQPKNPFDSPWEAFINFMNILNDFRSRLEQPLRDDPIENEVTFLKKLLEEKDRQLSIYQHEIDQLRKRKSEI